MEPITTATATETTAPPDLEVAREEHAAGMLERAVERAAPEPVQAPAPAAPAPAPVAAAPAPTATPVAEPPDPRQHPASRRFFERVTERAQRQAQAALAEKLQRSVEALERQAAGQPPATPAAAEPDFDADPKAWYEQAMDRKLREILGPLLQANQQQAETAEQQQQREIREAQHAAWQESMAQEMDFARELYSQTPEGELFDQRFDWFVNDFMVPGLMATRAVSEQEAQFMASAGIQAWTDFAMRRGMSPAVFIDTMIRNQVGAVANILLEAGFQPPNGQPTNGNGHRPPLQQRRQPNPEIAALQQTAAGAGSVAGIGRQTNAPRRTGSSAIAVAADPTVDNIRALAEEEFGGDVRKATAAVRRAALASEQAGARK